MMMKKIFRKIRNSYSLLLILYFLFESHLIKYFNLFTKDYVPPFIRVFNITVIGSFWEKVKLFSNDYTNVPLICSLSICLILLIFSIYKFGFKIKKVANFGIKEGVLNLFAKTFRADVKNVYGILSLLFILTNLGYTQDNFNDFLKGEGNYYIPLFTLFSIIVPILIFKFEANTVNVSNLDRKVLITALSKQFGNLENLVTPENGWFRNWEPIKYCLKYYPNLEEVILLASKDVQLQLQFFEKKNLNIEEIIKEINPKINVKVIFIKSSFFDFDSLYKEIKTNVEKMIKHRKDTEIIVNITSGTSPLSVALGFIEMKGHRGGVYQDQDIQKPDETNSWGLIEQQINVLTIKELWDEIAKY